MPGDILNIRMQTFMIDCAVCGEPDYHQWGIPTCNGDIVSNDFPEALFDRHGGSIPVCQSCFEKHRRGEFETFDRYYVRPGPMGVVLLNGSGI